MKAFLSELFTKKFFTEKWYVHIILGIGLCFVLGWLLQFAFEVFNAPGYGFGKVIFTVIPTAIACFGLGLLIEWKQESKKFNPDARDEAATFIAFIPGNALFYLTLNALGHTYKLVLIGFVLWGLGYLCWKFLKFDKKHKSGYTAHKF